MKWTLGTFGFWALVMLTCWGITWQLDHRSAKALDAANAGELNAAAVDRTNKGDSLLTPMQRINQYKDVYDAVRGTAQPDLKGGVLTEPNSTRTLLFLQELGRQRLQERRPQD